MTDSLQIFDRELLRRRRDRAAQRGQVPLFLLERAEDAIMDRLALVTRNFPVSVNHSANLGALTRRLSARPGTLLAISLEASEALLDQCDGAKALADDEALPIRDASADLAVSALALQHVNDLPGTLVQIRRALKPDGLFLGALLGGETLKELREAWLLAESEIEGGASPRVAPFADVRELGGLLQRAGFALPVADSDRLAVTYPNALALMSDLKAMGASNALMDRRRKPVSRRLIARVMELYAERFPAPNGRVRATFEIVTLTAWVPHESQQKPLRPGSAKSRLADALGVVETALPGRELPPSTKG